ncbi:DUF3313 domain-containing protein [Aestuariicella hydrocarbonica]|uniref:DUF3313 domain-containing protein n=1 Tax=Pseudomaricurvus hydrocarbonicus TaxID=1470433 RepID=A0A9E5MQ11_9GAMM|nr:DUF3313 family protein [Aestuariicella hydrocarbonica]NHO68227.1 DUF3313 domain-containing protein [Aestuariicella hydrocarbonica]
MRLGKRLCAASISSALAVLAGCTTPPPPTYDGLTLVPDTKFSTVYVKPNADITPYTTVVIDDCEVSFRKNWLRDQNSSRMDLTNRVTQTDVERIKTKLGEACKAHFKQAMVDNPHYTVSDSPITGAATLLLTPAIINLDINAPDVMRAGMNRTYTTSTGEMTLLLEAADATTNELMARVIDRARDINNNTLQWTNSVTNKAEADRVLRRWAKKLSDGLDEARKSQSSAL